MQESLKKILELPRKPILLLIWAYQKTVSPDHGIVKVFFPYGYCKYQPTCSEYGYEAIRRRGLIVGIPMTMWRILRCNPCSRGGHDPVK